MGAIKIGEYQDGVSGEVDITPNGIVAKNLNNEETFTLDGGTGDATFRGTIRASSFQNDNFNVDEEGNVIANSIKLASQNFHDSGVSLNQIFTSGTPVNATNGSFTFSLTQTTILLIQLDILGWLYQGSGSGDWGGTGIIRLLVDGGEVGRIAMGASLTGSDSVGALHLTPGSLHYIVALPAGDHTLQLTGAADQGVGVTYFNLYRFDFSYITLGNA